jgi:hypothetical protein
MAHGDEKGEGADGAPANCKLEIRNQKLENGREKRQNPHT